MHKEYSTFDLHIWVDAEVIVDLLIVIPHSLALRGNQTRIETIQLEVGLLFEKLFYLLVLLVESDILTAIWRCPTVFNLLSAKHNELEVICDETQALNRTCFKLQLGSLFFREFSNHSLEADHN